MAKMSPSEVKEFIKDCFMMREIPYVAGQGAIGKSSIVQQVAEEEKLFLMDVRLSQKLPEDLTGLPSLNTVNGRAVYHPFDTFPMAGDPLPKGYKEGDSLPEGFTLGDKVPEGYDGFLVFLDELSSASEEVMAGIYSLLLGNTVGGRKLHPRTMIAAAGNRSFDSAIARPLPDTIITRVIVCEMEVSSKDWLAWAKNESTDNTSAVIVIDFIKKYPHMLMNTADPKDRKELETYGNPRGWGKVFKIMKLHDRKAKDNQITRKDASGIPIPTEINTTITQGTTNLLNGSVGIVETQAFTEFHNETVQIPLPWEVAQAPAAATIPGSAVARGQLTGDLVAHFAESQDQTRVALLVYMNRMDPEYRNLFHNTLLELLGATPSDLRLLDKVKAQLGIDLITA